MIAGGVAKLPLATLFIGNATGFAGSGVQFRYTGCGRHAGIAVGLAVTATDRSVFFGADLGFGFAHTRIGCCAFTFAMGAILAIGTACLIGAAAFDERRQGGFIAGPIEGLIGFVIALGNFSTCGKQRDR